MNRETFSLSQKELQRVAVISACIKGEVACARAAELLCLSVRQIKRLKKRLREDGEAALAHASRGRPSPRRLPVRMRDRILHLARTRYVGFNDHHLCEKLREVEGYSLGRETLRRLLRQNGLVSPKKRRAPKFLWGQARRLPTYRRPLDGRRTACGETPTYPVWSRSCATRRHLHSCQQPSGQGPHRALVGHFSRPPYQ